LRRSGRLRLRAHAKINLHLDIGPRRPDGYHDLHTLFQEISLHDTLTFSVTKAELSLTVRPAGLPINQDNLVIRALERLRQSLRVTSGLRVRLDKRIPVGAGLGGGSSDAAAALLGGWALWKGRGRVPRRVPPLLFRIAKTLGADVPFFLKGGTAWGRGIGEKLTAVRACPRRWLVLIYPRVHVATKLAYQLLDKSRAGRKRAGGTAAALLGPVNSFEPVILKRFKPVAAAHQALNQAGCHGVLMSGSGSSVFGFAESRAQAERIARRLRARPWDVFVVHTR
jgi:4-diphosphocytidyl-2-C-methyl-D-erythritol kinase